MRQLAVLPNPDDARTLVECLRGLRIETRLEYLTDGCAVWVLDEDRLARAKEELVDFTRNPADPRFDAARKAADARRRRLEREEEEHAAGVAPPRPEPAPRPRPGPWTSGLMLTCVLVFVLDTAFTYQQYAGLGPSTALKYALHLTSDSDQALPSVIEQALAFSSYEMKRGDVVEPWPRQILSGQVWRLVTPIFLHFGPVHLLFNLSVLYFLGGMIERRRGAWRLLLLVLACALPSNVAEYVFSSLTWKDGGLATQMPGLFGGMSGVLYGLFGYVWMKSRYEPGLGLYLSPRLVLWMIAWLFLCMTGWIGPIANVAHVAGLIVGVVIGAAPQVWRLAARETRPM